MAIAFKETNMHNNERWFSNPTNIYWTCDALCSGRILSTRNQIREVKGWRLAAVIEKLRSTYGWPIITEYRGPEKVAYYRLPAGTEVSKLAFPPSASRLATERQQ